MGQALYRKYRSKKLSEIVGQSEITSALANAIKSQKLSHAYLFTGPRGVGKTSVARILAYEINNIKYEDDNLPLDIIEIDAASNRRIDEIRDLREKVMIAPVNAKYKVYIIDEVHMLTREAFNALLKTLEEPPAHVVFILATTEAHKLPDTIISRTQRYSFKLAKTEDVFKLLKNVSHKENIDIDDDAIYLLADHSGGSLRDALSLLDQTRHTNYKITESMIRRNLGIPPRDMVKKIIESIQSGSTSLVLKYIRETFDSGVNPCILASQLLNFLQKSIYLENNILYINLHIHLMENLIKVSVSANAELELEIALLKATINLVDNKAQNIDHQSADSKFAASKNEIKFADNNIVSSSESLVLQSDDVNIENNLSRNDLKNTESSNDPDIWAQVLNGLKSTHNTLYSVLRMAQPQFENSTLVLKFKFPFHQKRVNDSKNKDIISESLKKHGLLGYQIKCLVIDKLPKAKKEDDNIPKELSQIRNIFGGAEMLE